MIEIKQSNLFPFELYWDACDIVTKKMIRIPSGEWIHGVIIPEFEDIEPIPLQLAPEIIEMDRYNSRLLSFIYGNINK